MVQVDVCQLDEYCRHETIQSQQLQLLTIVIGLWDKNSGIKGEET